MNSRIGMALGFAGAAIDFVSAYLFLSDSMITTDDMGVMVSGYNLQGIGWGVGLFALGILLAFTSVLGLSSFGNRRMRNFGFLMAGYGVVMIIIGSLMYSGFTPMMNGALYSAAGMLVIGFLMLISGSFMLRKIREKMPETMRRGAVSDPGQK